MPNLTAGTIAGRRYRVGDTGPGGGIIYMTPTYTSNQTQLDNTTGQYYECAPPTWNGGSYDPVNSFGCYNTLVCPTSNVGIGYGLYDSECYAANCSDPYISPIAVNRALNLTLNGYSDWFLPSRNELTVLQHQLVDYGNIFGLTLYGPPEPPGTSSNYWSSSEASSAQTWSVLMLDSIKLGYGAVDKNASYSIRPVRSFYARYE
jgi:hypothetical protein